MMMDDDEADEADEGATLLGEQKIRAFQREGATNCQNRFGP
jgi:hypothetical protein